MPKFEIGAYVHVSENKRYSYPEFVGYILDNNRPNLKKGMYRVSVGDDKDDCWYCREEDIALVCTHDYLMIHVFTEIQTPYYLRKGEIDFSTNDDYATIRPDMGATCQFCTYLDVTYADWRTAPPELLPLFAKVRHEMVETEEVIDGYPLPEPENAGI